MVKLKEIAQDEYHVCVAAHISNKSLNQLQLFLILPGKVGIRKKDHFHGESTEVIVECILPGSHEMAGIPVKF